MSSETPVRSEKAEMGPGGGPKDMKVTWKWDHFLSRQAEARRREDGALYKEAE